jgi:hypothetical protein
MIEDDAIMSNKTTKVYFVSVTLSKYAYTQCVKGFWGFGVLGY